MVSKRRKSRLPASIQHELIRYFVAGASARSAAELCGVNRNSAILYFHKLRELMAERQVADAPDLMAGEIEVDESYFAVSGKANAGVVRQAKYRSLGCSNVAVVSTRSQSQTPAQKRSSLSLRAKYSPTVSSTRTASGPMMSSMSQTSIMSASTTRSCLPKTATTSTGSRTSGTRPNDTCDATTASQSTTSISISKSASGASTTGRRQIC